MNTSKIPLPASEEQLTRLRSLSKTSTPSRDWKNEAENQSSRSNRTFSLSPALMSTKKGINLLEEIVITDLSREMEETPSPSVDQNKPRSLNETGI